MSERNTPITERPHMPGYGIEPGPAGLLPWSWATRRLTDSHTYWVATRDPGGAPHLAAIWAIWHEGALCFATSGTSRKARNLAVEPRCAITPGDGVQAVTVEGVARLVGDAAEFARVGVAYAAKYGEGIPDGAENLVFAVAPVTAFGFDEAAFIASATRWRFEPGRAHPSDTAAPR